MKNFFLLLFVFQCSMLLAQPDQEDSLAAGPREEVFTVVETMPQFPGGERAMMQYIADKLEYPAYAKENGIQGRVVVSFVVDITGKITEVKILKDIGGGCGEAAAKVIRNMPPWKPGTQKGKPVRVRYTIPVLFRLETDDSPKKKKKKKGSRSNAGKRDFTLPPDELVEYVTGGFFVVL